MKRVLKISLMLFLSFYFIQGAIAQKKVKKVQKFKVTKVVELSAEEVWDIMGVDYGAVAYSHPKIVSSEYINGSLRAEKGAQRVCYFNDKQTKFLKEKILEYDHENMTLVNTVSQVGKFPLSPDHTVAIYKVEDLGNGKSLISFDMQFRTKPAFMGALAKGKFKKLIKDYMISIEHHLRTGERVTKENFKKIRKQYS